MKELSGGERELCILSFVISCRKPHHGNHVSKESGLSLMPLTLRSEPVLSNPTLKRDCAKARSLLSPGWA
jgi:hypothetical protein